MKKEELLEKFKIFKEDLEKHIREFNKCRKYNYSLSPIRNITIKRQLEKLSIHLQLLDNYINKYTSGRIIQIHEKGISIDIYKEGIRNNNPKIKEVCLSRMLFDLTAIIAKIKNETEEVIKSEKELDYTSFFDNLMLHHEIIKVSESQFKSGHFSDAIKNAFQVVINYIKTKSNINLDGYKLITEAFKFKYNKEKDKIEEYPIIKLNKLSNEPERDEQEGFKFLFMGSVLGIRNVYTHEFKQINDPILTLKYLSLASLLLERVDESTKKI